MVGNAGAFAAIAALFGGPLTAGVMLTEVSLGAGAVAAVPALLPGFVAAAVGYLVFVGFGEWGGLDAPGLRIPDLPVYEGTHLADLAVAVAVGVTAAVLLAAVRVLGRRVNSFRRPLGMPALLLAGGLAVGLCAQIAVWLGAGAEDVLFSGQSSMGALVAEESSLVLVVLLAAKLVAYAVSLGCGFRGGPIFPAIFLGVALAAIAIGWFDMSPTFAIAVGSAAGMAAQARLVVTSLLFAALLVGGAGLDAIPAAVLAVAAAWITAATLDRHLDRHLPPHVEAA